MNSISLISVFWGNWHTEMFLEGCISSLLSEKNLPSMAKIFNINYLISTNRGNLKKIENNLYFLELKKIVNIEFHCFNDDLIPIRNEYDDEFEYSKKCTKNLIQYQNLIIKNAFKNSIGLIYIHPDCLYSSNIFEYVSKMIVNGVYLLFCPGFRVDNNSIFIDYAKKNILLNIDQKYEFSRLVYNNLNIYHREQFIDSEVKSKYPSAQFYKSENGLLIKEFHEKVPLYISSFFKNTPILNGIDSDYDVSLYKQALLNNKKVIYIDSSENGLIASLIKEDYGLLDRWRVNGNLYNYNIDIKKNKFFNSFLFNKVKFILKSHYIFRSDLQKFSSRHFYNLIINDNIVEYNKNIYFHKILIFTSFAFGISWRLLLKISGLRRRLSLFLAFIVLWYLLADQYYSRILISEKKCIFDFIQMTGSMNLNEIYKFIANIQLQKCLLNYREMGVLEKIFIYPAKIVRNIF